MSKQGKPYAEIVPERRYYDVRTMTMSEVGLDAGLWGDLYIVMGDNLGNGEFTFRLHYKPLIRWLWLGGILMALGALCSAINLKRNAMNKKFILFLPLILLLSVCLLLLLVCIKIQNKLPLHSLISPCRNSIKQIYLNRVKSSAQEISQRNLSCLMCGEVGVAIANKNTLS